MPTLKIDLHGIKHEDAKRVLINEIEAHWDRDYDFIVVTGHSPKMRKLAIEILKEYSLKWSLGLHSSYLRVMV